MTFNEWFSKNTPKEGLSENTAFSKQFVEDAWNYGYHVAKEEASNLIEELASSLSVVGECGKEECELINKAQKFINKPIF